VDILAGVFLHMDAHKPDAPRMAALTGQVNIAALA